MLYVVLSDGGLRYCSQNNNNNEQDYYYYDDDNQKDINNNIPENKISGIITPPRQQHIMILFKTDGRWLQFDLVNRIANAPAIFYGDALAWRVGGDEALIVYRQATQEIRTLVGVSACPLDQIFPLPLKYTNTNNIGAASCVSMQCIRKSVWWCGPNSTRDTGSPACLCNPGFFFSSDEMCVPCPSTKFYCSGGRAAPTSCPENSVVLSAAAASSAAACVCLAGFYRYADSICLPCPSNHWCPLFFTSSASLLLLPSTAVVPCHGGGETNGGGMISPLDCICPPRTFGVHCQPCDADADCSSPVSQPPQLVATVIIASVPPQFLFFISAADHHNGASNQKQIVMDQCVTWAVSVVYEIESASAASQIWVVISPASFVWQNATQCLSLHGFNLLSVRPLGPPRVAVGVKQSVRCAGIAQEWMKNGCGCIAGYEPLATPSWGIQCFPCLNGTARAQYSAGGCEPCKNANEVAPSMGMAACVCAPGYSGSSKCVISPKNNNKDMMITTVTTSFLASLSSMHTPSGIVIMIVVGVAVGCALLTFALVSAYCFLC